MKKRFLILDALRGFALLGIILANFPEFGLWTFLSSEAQAEMPTAAIDNACRFLEYFLIDGKFYTLFSLLFGIGFSIIIRNAEERGANGFRLFYRRMAILLIFGLLHMLFLWSGDILALYAVLGMLLPLFRKASNKALLGTASILFFIPVIIDLAVEHRGFDPAAWFNDKMWYYCDIFGITEENYAYWLQEQTTYTGMLQFLVQGTFERMTEFINGNRYFKVMGLFLIGFYLGKNRIYADINKYKLILRKVAKYGFSIGIPLSLLYAHSATSNHPWGLATHTMLYTLSVYPLAFGYASLIALIHNKKGDTRVFKLFAAPGRMALTNYISQTLFGIIIFYGIGFAFGAQTGLVFILIIALGIYLLQIIFSSIWLKHFENGPLEWLWRKLYRR